MVIDEDIYLEHFGVKGMQWGVRKAVSGSVSTGKAIGRGTKRTVKYVNRNKKTVAKVAAGAAFAAALLAGGNKVRNSRIPPISSAKFAKTAAVGKSRIAHEGLGVLRVRSIDVISREVLRPVVV
ncbi:MAG: hypothetical protein H0U49_05745 [Parachlamydiaceae bacterium]|nr:hypothetical protein [Parachlamydiaceae bacterium]